MAVNYFQRLNFLAEDDFSKRLDQFQLTVTAFGCFRTTTDEMSITNMVVPHHRVLYVTKGSITYTAGDKAVQLAVGDALYTPANTIFSATGNDPADPPQFLYVYFSVLPHHLARVFSELMQGRDGLFLCHAQHSKAEYYFYMIQEEFQAKAPGYYRKIQCHLNSLVIELLRARGEKRHTVPALWQPHTTSILNQATSYISANLSKNLKVEEVSAMCGVSSNYLYKIFKNALGVSPQQYIQSYKIECAAQMLLCSTLNITQIAREVGFSSSNHFSNAFYSIKKIRPGEFRAREKAK